MTSWQRLTRAGVAAIFIATAVGVYLSLGERRGPGRGVTSTQLPPRVVAQTTNSALERVEGITPTFEVHSKRSDRLDDGTTKLIGVTIKTTNRDGRGFVVTAQEATVGKNNVELELRGGVRLREDDGFELATENARFNRDNGILSAPGDVSFSKERMRGNGVGMTYDQHADVLQLDSRAHVQVAASGPAAGMDFRAGSGTLDRTQHVLTLTRTVRVVHGEQTIDTRSATAHLSTTDDLVQFVELREQSSVTGGLGSVASMGARDMDLDYSDDGQRIEKASLLGGGSVVMTAAAGAAGRRIAGERLDITLRTDGSLDRIEGTAGVSMTLPPAEGAPGRAVKADTLNASARPDGSLSNARFNGHVTFSEDTAEGNMRTATAGALQLEMKGDAIGSALFTETPTFTDGDLRAHAAEARYEPTAGTLGLRGKDSRGEPGVQDERVTIDAELIDIVLDGPRITARNKVKSAVRGGTRTARSGGAADDSKLPGLLKQDRPVTITADNVTYDSASGVATYTGRAWLRQEDTEITANTIELQQKGGDLTARGQAQSRLVLDTGRSDGSGDELTYVDADRTITYTSRRAAAAKEAPLAHLVGPQGDLRGRRIRLFLASEESRLERLTAEDDVMARIDDRTVRGATLTYDAKSEVYVVTGSKAMPLRTEEQCSDVNGSTLTYNRPTGSMNIKERGQQQTHTTRKASC